MSAGKHALAVAQTLEQMKLRYEAMPEPTLSADRVSRAATLALHEAIMPLLAAERDENGLASDESFAQGTTHALGNLIASLASCFTDGTERQVIAQTNMLCRATAHRAMLRAMDPNRGVVVWHAEPAAGPA